MTITLRLSTISKILYHVFQFSHIPYTGLMPFSDLVHVQQGEEFVDLLRGDVVLGRGVPVCAAHLVLDLIHPQCTGGDPDAARLMEAHCLERPQKTEHKMTSSNMFRFTFKPRSQWMDAHGCNSQECC